MLDKQYNLYSADTADFYSNHEKYLHNINGRYRKEQVYVKNKLTEARQKLKKLGYTDSYIKDLKNITNADSISDKNISTCAVGFFNNKGNFRHTDLKVCFQIL